MKKRYFTAAEIKKIENIEIHYSKSKNFFHCQYCIEQFLGSPLHKAMTPREYGMYEVSSYSFIYPHGEKSDIIVVWCKRCGRKVWDSRAMAQLY